MRNFKIYFIKDDQEKEMTKEEYDNCFPLKSFIKDKNFYHLYNTKLDELYRLCMNKKYNNKFKEVRIKIGDHYKIINLNNKNIEVEIMESIDFLNK